MGENGKHASIGILFVNVYLVDRAYGGPEEGGWWYGCGELVQSIGVPARKAKRCQERVQKVLDKWNSERRSNINSVLSEGRFELSVDSDRGVSYPQYRPYYE